MEYDLDVDNLPIQATDIANGRLIPCKRGNNGAVLRDKNGNILLLELVKHRIVAINNTSLKELTMLTLEYNKDVALIHLRCRVTRADSQPEFAYEVDDLVSEFDSVTSEQFAHLLPQATTSWCSSEEEARAELITLVCTAFDTFGTWPQYKDHGYLPGETYEGEETAFPPGVNMYAGGSGS